MAAGLFVGAGFLGLMGSKFARNYFADPEAAKNLEDPHRQRMDGVGSRLLAHPRLLEQYNEKYIEKQMENNSALRYSQSSQIMRTRSDEFKRRASGKAQLNSPVVSDTMAGA